MTDYTELVNELRYCKNDAYCSICSRYEQSRCFETLHNDAAAAIEKMAKHITEMHELVTVLQIDRGQFESEVKEWRRLNKENLLPDRRQLHWVSVEEPPRDGQECIIAYSGPTDWIYEHATYHSDLNEALEEDVFIEGTDGFIVDEDVGYARHGLFKYWMPLPEPPQEVQDGTE